MVQRLDSNLSRVLLDEGFATGEVLEEAAQQQLIHGGALDTLLLELGRVDEAVLARALATAWETPLVDPKSLRIAPEECAARIPERVAVSLGICPIGEDRGAIHVVVAAPPDRLLLDEVSALVGRPLIPHVVLEVRLFELLHRAYDALLEERFVALLRHLDNAPNIDVEKRKSARVVARPPDLDETRWDVVEALAHLAAQDSRAGIADVAVRYARQFLPFAAIFGVRHGVAVGWRRSGPAEGPQFESVELPVPDHSVLAQVLESPSPLLGKPPITDGNAAFFGWLGRRRPRTALLIPIIVARRTVAVLAADGGVRAQTFDALSDLVAFGARLGAAFEALLRARHRAHADLFIDAPKSSEPTEEVVATPPPSPSTATPEAPPPTSRDGTSPFARGYVPPKPRGPTESTPPVLTMASDGSWSLVVDKRPVTTRPVVEESSDPGRARPPVDVAGRSPPDAGRDEDALGFEDVPSSSEIASFEKGPTSTEIASFEGTSTPHPEGGTPLGAGGARAATRATGDDDDFAGVSGMYRLLPRDSGDVDAAAFSAAIAMQQTRSTSIDDVERVERGLDMLETGGFENLLEPRVVVPSAPRVQTALPDASSPWVDALAETVAKGLQGGTSSSSIDAPVLAEDEGWEDVVLDRAYHAALHASPERASGLPRAAESSPPRPAAPSTTDDEDDEESIDGAVLEAIIGASTDEARQAPIGDVDDDAILPALSGTLVETDDDDDVPTGPPAAAASPTPIASPVVEITAPTDAVPRAAPTVNTTAATTPPTTARAPTAKELVGMLDALAADRVAEAKRQILERGAAMVPALIEAFPGRLLVDPFADDARVERSADLGPLIEVCEALGPRGLDVALAHLDSRFPAHRFAATFLFVVVPDERAIDHVRPRLHDFEARVGLLATAALSHFMAHPRFIHVLSHLRQRLAVPSHEARARAATLLGNFRDVGAIPVLIRLLDEKEPVLSAAHGALVRIALVDLGTKSKAWDKWWERARQKTRIDWLIDALRHKERDMRFVAATELVEIAGQDFGYDCDRAKRDREDAVRRVEAWWSSERAAIGM